MTGAVEVTGTAVMTTTVVITTAARVTAATGAAASCSRALSVRSSATLLATAMTAGQATRKAKYQALSWRRQCSHICLFVPVLFYYELSVCRSWKTYV